jgi:hypothetical protein
MNQIQLTVASGVEGGSWGSEAKLVSADHFRHELLSRMKRAGENGATDVLINSAELRHSLRGGDFGTDVCCDVMEAEMKPGDVLVQGRTSGAGLTVRYLLPRTDHC